MVQFIVQYGYIYSYNLLLSFNIIHVFLHVFLYVFLSLSFTKSGSVLPELAEPISGAPNFPRPYEVPRLLHGFPDRTWLRKDVDGRSMVQPVKNHWSIWIQWKNHEFHIISIHKISSIWISDYKLGILWVFDDICRSSVSLRPGSCWVQKPGHSVRQLLPSCWMAEHVGPL